MLYKCTNMCKRFATFGSLIWFLLNVCSAMLNKTHFNCENLVTLAELVLFPPSMCHQMTRNITIMKKYFVSSTALKWLLPNVKNITLKIVVLCESLVTLAALIWSIPRMHPDLSFKI